MFAYVPSGSGPAEASLKIIFRSLVGFKKSVCDSEERVLGGAFLLGCLYRPLQTLKRFLQPGGFGARG